MPPARLESLVDGKARSTQALSLVSWLTVRRETQPRVKFSLSKATLPVDRPNRAGTAAPRQSCRYVEKARFDKMLSSQEIKLLISALGAGIGKEDTDLAKLRYHTVILMTDADVDGSHIRTLLLTFFYRQLPGVIEEGHLYIAQPPLYRVKKGKTERYLRDEAALEDFLIDLGIENLRVETLAGGQLKAWVKTFLHCEKLLDFVERKGRDRRLVSALLNQSSLSLEVLKDRLLLQEFLA